MSELTAAYDPSAYFAQARQALLADAGVKPDDLHRAVKRHRKLLHATKTREFVHEGRVIQGAALADNDVQARAVELFYDLLGVKAPRAASSTASAGVEVVIDAQSGQVIVRAVTK